MITQEELKDVLRQREEVVTAYNSLKHLEQELMIVEDNIRKRLKKGFKVEEGKHTAEVEVFERTYLPYKEICEKHLGLSFLEKLRKKTKARKYPKLRIDGKVFTKSNDSE